MTPPIRKLAAIVFTDIVGFTKLSAQDEPRALDLLKKQRELLKPIVDEHDGSWLKEIGDGLLLTFNTNIEAVLCSIAIQEAAKSIPELDLRIGIHQGEVVFEENDVLGDDVNIAARIEPFAAPGGISISGRVNASLERDPAFQTAFLGSPNMKGVSQDVKIFSIVSHGLPGANKISDDIADNKAKLNWNIYSITGAILAVVGALFWINLSLLSPGIASDNEIPSVVILPFENKGEAKDEYYAYGISSDIISDITSVGQLRVASLSSVEELQNEGLKNNEIADKLSSRYVVSGSLWKIDSIFQLSIELFDTQEKMLLASQRWETKWTDLSLVKGDLTKKIIEGLRIKIINELDNNYTIDPVAYELYLKAKHTFENRTNIQDNQVAKELIEKALSLDSNFVDAKYYQGHMYHGSDNNIALSLFYEANKLAVKMKDKQALMNVKKSMGHIYSERMDIEKSLKLFQESYKLSKEIGNESSIATAMMGLGSYYWEMRNGDSTRFYWEKTLELYEKLDDRERIGAVTNNLAIVYWIFDNELDKAITMFERAYELSGTTAALSNIGEIYNRKGEFDKSLDYYDRALNRHTRVNNTKGIAHMHRLYGHHYQKLHDYESAIRSYKISFDLYSELRYERWKSVTLGRLIACYEALGDKENVERYHARISEVNTNIAAQFYLQLGFNLLKLDNYELARQCFFKQLELEKKNSNSNGIINTLTNIGLSYFYDEKYVEALDNFNKAINQEGIENLFDTVETLTFKHLSEKELGLPINEEYLMTYVQEKFNKKATWYEDVPEYINWALYELFRDSKYIKESKRRIDRKLEMIKSIRSEKYLSYTMQRKILESFNKIKNS